MNAIDEVREGAAEISQPIAIFQAGDELIADKKAVADFFTGLGSEDKTYKEYPGFYHEILNEFGKGQVLSDMTQWINTRLAR